MQWGFAMENVLLVVHLIIAVAMILLILIQRNAQDGGGLMGGGGTMGGLFTARGSANALTRTTAILAVSFIVTSLLLTILANHVAPRAANLIDQIAPLPVKEAPVNNNTPGTTTDPKVKPQQTPSDEQKSSAPDALAPTSVNPIMQVPNPVPDVPKPELPQIPQVPMGK